MLDSMLALTNSLKEKRIVLVDSIAKTIVGMARYATINSPDSEYIKISFSDGTGMYYTFYEENIYYIDKKIGTAEGIDDGVIGNLNTLFYNDVEYTLTNRHDYQFVKEFYIGTVKEHEGEVRFSDYADANGNTLSLGWNLYAGKRDDVLAVPIALSRLTFA